MTRLLLDLYCAGGGAARGYAEAGFEVIGVDSDASHRKRYPFRFMHADVLGLDVEFLRLFDAIHASPPCQFGTELRHAPGTKKDHPNLIPATRRLLMASGKPYVIENVEDVRPHLIEPYLLCGSMFDLGAAGCRLQRHRLFETNFPMTQPECRHDERPVIGVYGGHIRLRSAKHGGRGTADFVGQDKPAIAAEAMGIEGLTMNQLSEAIPPAYTKWIGDRIMSLLDA